MNAIPETTVIDRTDCWIGGPAARRAVPIVDPLSKRKDRIGRFEVLGVIGCGSFGVVYEGYDRFRRRQVAIKVCSRCDPDARRRATDALGYRLRSAKAGRLK